MRVLSLITLAAIAICVSRVNAQPITAADAKSHIGENTTVCGKVASERTATKSKGAPTFINLDTPYPNQIFTIVIWGNDRPNIAGLPNLGSRICATGTIQEYRGVPEIVARSAGQLSK